MRPACVASASAAIEYQRATMATDVSAGAALRDLKRSWSAFN
jgi:hypothetical protein